MGWSTAAVLIALTLGLVAAPLDAAAQPARKVHRIGYIAFEPPPTPDIPAIGLASLQQGLRELGYVEGDNLVVEYRWVLVPGTATPPERVPQLVADLVGRKVEVIVTYATTLAVAVQRETKTVPIVCAVCADLVGGGAVASLAKPGGNVTGLTVIAPDLAAKRIEFLKALGASRVIGVHGGPETLPVIASMRRAHEQAARALGVRGEALRADSQEAVEQLVASIKGRETALVFMESPGYVRARRGIAALALRHGLMTAFPFREHVEAGGLLSYGTNMPTLFRRAATYVDKILKGAKPADLPVEQPTEFELVINLKTAKALGITIPPALLIQATEVIQ
jgi:putative tryptophan/tyrosine transport system substrate-binding protein